MGEILKFESPAQKLEKAVGDLREVVTNLILQNKTNPDDVRHTALQIEHMQWSDQRLREEILSHTKEMCESDPTVCQSLINEYTRRKMDAHR